uniref:Succinate dehydrogenase subunit 4 n=1 Tax=Cyanophora paradoxa TaxID=2762 RepID=A0A097PBM6_CYAPA|nr:succinate dehydrogenase subunit 4 [Cyanophora paradoxa]
MNLYNHIKIGKIEWYVQKISSLLILTLFFFDMNIFIIYIFNLLLHIELGFDSILEDYYQNILLKAFFNFLFKFILILTLSLIYSNSILILV